MSSYFDFFLVLKDCFNIYDFNFDDTTNVGYPRVC